MPLSNVRSKLMIKRLLFLILVLPFFSWAELEVVCRPSTLTLQLDVGFDIFIYVKNTGKKSVIVPWAQPDEEGRIRPPISSEIKLICFDGDRFKVQGGIHSMPSHIDFGGFACSSKTLPDGTRESKCAQLPAPPKPRKFATFIEPGETLVYYYSSGQQPPEMIPNNPVDMYIITLEFNSFDISIPPITMMPRKK